MTISNTAHTESTAISRLVPAVIAGIAGGLIGGVVFGVLMQMMDMIGMVAMLVGSKSMAVGWLVHLAISAFIGAGFAALFSRLATSTARAVLFGMGYGVAWWVLGALPERNLTQALKGRNPSAQGDSPVLETSRCTKP
jgi:hypothetical protein